MFCVKKINFPAHGSANCSIFLCGSLTQYIFRFDKFFAPPTPPTYHISPCRLGRNGKKLFKPEYISGQGPTQKKIDQFADPCAGKLIFSRKTLGLIGHMNICWKKNEKISLCDVIAKDVFAEGQKFCDSRILWVKFHICLKIACVKVLTNIMSGPVPTWCKNLCILVHKQMASLHACSSFSALYFLRPT